MSDKHKFPLAAAMAVARKIVEALGPACKRIEIAGSIRRRKEQVGDIEILYIPKITHAPDPGDLFGKEIPVNAADLAIDQLMREGKLGKRQNVLGSNVWGESNKLARAVKTGIPVDLFSATESNWWNYLVCRTGSAQTNMRIAGAAIKAGYMWHPTRYGFEQTRVSEPGMVRHWRMESERDVFGFIGMKYLEPWER